MSVAGFDVFDTVLTRLLGGPRQVFVESGRRLRAEGILDLAPEAYAATREQVGWDLTPDLAQHPTLHRVAVEVASRLGLGPAAVQAIERAETAVESDTCRAVPGAVDRVDRARRETGRGIAYVSDTSLPQAFLQDLLAREGLLVPGDRLWTSCGAGSSKQQGGLFAVVAADLGIAATELSYRGDDRWSDVAHARLAGATATLDTRAALGSRERSLERAGVATDGLGPRLAGAARMARLRASVEGVDPGLAAVGSAVALPLLVGFGLWVRRQARLLGLDRLYFVSRDGEVFREVTAALAGAPLDHRYLYGSRRAWQLAAPADPARPWLPDDTPGAALTARQVLAVVDLDADEALARSGDPLLARPDEVLGEDGWARLQALLAGDLRAEVERRAAERRELLLAYLDQEGVTAPGRVGLVDVGWTGRAARSLEDVLASAGRPLPAAHLFLGLLASAPERMGADLYARSRGWLLDEARGRPAPTGGDDPVMVVESFAMGREGHTEGYRRAGDRVVPVLAANVNPAAARWDLDGYRRVLGWGLSALEDGSPLDDGVDLRTLASQQLQGFWSEPGEAEARAWGAQPYGEDFANTEAHPLATPATGRRLATRAGLGDPAWREPTYWLAGTVALSPQPWRGLLTAAGRAQQVRRRLPRIPARLRAEWVLRR